MLQHAQISILGSNEIAREGLKLILVERGFGVTCVSMEDAIDTIADLDDDPHHVVVVDVDSEGEGLDLCRVVRDALPSVRLALMCAECSGELLKKAFANGVDGVLMKKTSRDPMVSILDLIALGEKIVPSHLISELGTVNIGPSLADWDQVKSGGNLSDREIAILRCLIDGDANKIISRRLGIAEATVKVHVKAILRKLHVLNRTQAAIWAVNKGFAREPPAGTANGAANGAAT